jgi:hypothetical protein
LSVGFSHHYEILVKKKPIEERPFYIQKCTTGFWSYRTLQYHLKENLFPGVVNSPTISNNVKTFFYWSEMSKIIRELQTVWLIQTQMSELFQTTKNNITLHIGNIFKKTN